MRCAFHHCTDLSSVTYGEFLPSPVRTYRKLSQNWSDDETTNSVFGGYVYDEIGANWWLEKQVGFYPLFMAVGSARDDLYMTGYAQQFARRVSTVQDKNSRNGYRWILRDPGEFPNYVLFSYKNPPSPKIRFLDYSMWFMAIYSAMDDFVVCPNDKKMIFKASYSPADWLRRAKRDKGNVMAVVDCLDLREADRIWVRNQQTAKSLRDMGFRNVFAKRIPVPPY